MDLDRVDVAILRALQADARLSYRELSRRVGVSVPTVSARVANLEQIGVLSGYHAAVDPERLGQLRVVLVLRCAGGREASVGTALAALDEVRWTVQAEASHVVGEAVLTKRERLARFLTKVREIDGVRSLEYHVARKAFKDTPRARVSRGVSAILECFECGQVIEGDPVRWRMDGRTHYLCCPSCERLYKDRYRRLKAGAVGGQPRRRAGSRTPGRPLAEHPGRRV